MANSHKKAYFLSLKWKIVLFVLLVLGLVGIMIELYFYLHFYEKMDLFHAENTIILANTQKKASLIHKHILYIIWVAMLIATILGYLCFSPATKRLKKQANLLPLLSNNDFSRIRRNTQLSSQTWIDEIYLIEQSSIKLVDNMERLHHQMLERTIKLEHLSMWDELTSLPNKELLQHELTKAIACVGRIHQQITLLFLDLDEFKRINETLNHQQGDKLLQTVALRLTESLRNMDTVFRYGGDEFIVLLRGIENDEQVRQVIHKIFSSLQHPILLNKHKLIVTTSIGIAHCDNPKIHAEELIRYAELAMYQAKKAGRSNYRVFTIEMLDVAQNRMMIEQDIGLAVSDNQLSLMLQPIVHLQTEKLRGFEALIRWFHPTKGLIMPNQFIPELENSEATIEVGNYVLKRGVQILKSLQDHGWEHLYLTVNLSVKHCMSAGLSEYIKTLLSHYEVPATSLVLEITEESVIDQLSAARTVFEQIRATGVRIAIDDFGTGYASFNYLKQLPFDVIKIDRSFTQDINHNSVDAHIVNTVVKLAHNLNRIVVAEGIETEEQAEFMKNIGCELAQGFLYSKPISQQKIFKVLEQIQKNPIWPKTLY